MSSKLIFLTPVLIQYFLFEYCYCASLVFYDLYYFTWIHFAVALGERQVYTGRLYLILKKYYCRGFLFCFLFFPFHSVLGVLMAELLSIIKIIISFFPLLSLSRKIGCNFAYYTHK